MIAAAGTASTTPRKPNSAPPRQQREYHPDGVQTDPVADQLRRHEIALDDLADHENGGNDGDRLPCVELGEGEPDRRAEPDQHPEIGNERDQSRAESDYDGEFQPRERESDGVERAQPEANQPLSADEAGQGLVDQLDLLADRIGVVPAAARGRPWKRSGPSREAGRTSRSA